MSEKLFNKLEIFGEDNRVMEVRCFLRGKSDEDGYKYIDFNKIIPSPDNGENSGWNYDNWGAKWNAFFQKSPNINTIEFVTANYGVPDLIIMVSEKFSDVIFVYHFDMHDCPATVTLFIKNGIATEIPQECFHGNNLNDNNNDSDDGLPF